MKVRFTVGKNLVLLLVSQLVVLSFTVFMSIRALDRISGKPRQEYESRIQSIDAIFKAMQEANETTAASHSVWLEEFLRRYREEWDVATSASEGAIRFRDELRRGGEADLLRRESDVVKDLKHNLHAGSTEAIKENLSELHAINIRYGELNKQYAVEKVKRARWWELTTGIISTVVTLFIGLMVYFSVIPRAQTLIDQVRQFNETGTHERIGYMGNDAIGMLANSLDAGMTAIADREKERNQFLSIVAHELKTPLTSIQGYSSLVKTHPQSPALLVRALEVINRQSWRLSRLIDGLFLAMRARSKNLTFVPKPFDLSSLVDRVLDEMKPFVSETAFESHIASGVSILGDEALLEQALWSLLTSASALSLHQAPVQVELKAEDWKAVLTLKIQKEGSSVPEMEDLFQPFRSIEYETGSNLRFTTGLYLCREIVRVHNGDLYVRQTVKNTPEFVMELPK